MTRNPFIKRTRKGMSNFMLRITSSLTHWTLSMRRTLLLFVLFTSALFAGCASAPYMPLAEDSPSLDPSKPLFLMSVVVNNAYKERWQPRILNVILETNGEAGKPQTMVFRMDAKGTVSPEAGASTYLVRFPTGPAPHRVQGFNAMASAFPINGFYFVPLHAGLAKSEGGVHYLGSMKAVIRERKDGEFRAGPPVPLIDQAFSGASGGTFDIEITDAYDADTALFRKTFAALKDVEIKKAVLPKWDRAKAQLLWEQN